MNALEVPTDDREGPGRMSWRRPRRCTNATCVEVALADDLVWVRDSKDPDGPVLRFTTDEWVAFVSATVAGEFDIPGPRLG